MEVIVPVPQALLAFGSWRLASLPPSACRQTGFNGRLDSMANWIQWQTGFNGKLGYRVDTQPFSAVLFSCDSDLGICGAVLFRRGIWQNRGDVETGAAANPRISKPVNTNRPPVKLAESPGEVG